MTPTEAAAVAVIYSIPIGFFVYKGLTVRGLLDALRDSGVTAAVVMLMMFMVMILSRLYVLLNLPNKMVEVMLGISSNKNVILLLVNIFMVIIGMLMDDNSGTLLCGPILLPVVMAVGVSPVQFAAILGVNLGMGTITPPAAPLLYLGSRTAKVPVKDMLVPSLKIICFAWIPTLILTTYFPDLSLFLPRLFGFNV
jgi:tripartite ATP-independent transporter DctM subunit